MKIFHNEKEVFWLYWKLDKELDQIKYFEDHYRELGYEIEIHEYYDTLEVQKKFKTRIRR